MSDNQSYFVILKNYFCKTSYKPLYENMFQRATINVNKKLNLYLNAF